MAHPVRFAVIGFGHIGKRHARIIMDHPEAVLTAIADTNVSLRKEAENNSNCLFFKDVSDLAGAEIHIDVAIIATPNGLHAEHAIELLERGCHVVIEKPMSLSKEECEAVIKKATEVSKQVFCVMQNRYSPPSKWLKEMITDKLLGEIFMVEINCFWNRDERYYEQSGNLNGWKGKKLLDGGPLFTQFSHFIDMMYWIFGDIKNIQSRLYNFNHRKTTEFFDDSGLINFEFLAGGSGCFNYSTAVWDKNLESSIRVIGENGSIKVGGQYMESVTYCHVKNYTMADLPPSNPPNDYGGYTGSAANHVYVIQNVIDTLLGRSVMSTSAEDGMKVVEIIERMYSVGSV